jgi:hypothetical protein
VVKDYKEGKGDIMFLPASVKQMTSHEKQVRISARRKKRTNDALIVKQIGKSRQSHSG